MIERWLGFALALASKFQRGPEREELGRLAEEVRRSASQPVAAHFR